jgi:hypothetical protein
VGKSLIGEAWPERFAAVQIRQFGSEISKSGATRWAFPVAPQHACLFLADMLHNDPDFQKLISEPEPKTIYK